MENDDITLLQLCSYLKQIQDIETKHKQAQWRVGYYRKTLRLIRLNGGSTIAVNQALNQANLDVLRAKQDYLNVSAKLKNPIAVALKTSQSQLIFQGGSVQSIKTCSGNIPSGKFAEMADQFEAITAMNEVLSS